MKKENIVLIGDYFNLVDIVEIFLYRKYNVIATTDLFDGIKKTEECKPICIFIKISDNINPPLTLMSKLENLEEHLKNIPVIAFSKDKVTAINEAELKTAGIREIIKFPINYQDFEILTQRILDKEI